MPNSSNHQVYKAEKTINDVLFGLCLFITLAALGMVLTQFFSRGDFPPPRIDTFYIGVLLVYSLHKEALRWLQEKGSESQQRKGEYFVYIWIIITALLYLINFLTHDYFSYSQSGEQVATLAEMSFTTLEVGGVFLFTRLFKIASLYLFAQKNK